MSEPTNPPTSYPPEAILTADEVAAWLKVSSKTVKRWPLRTIDLGSRTKRFLAADVYAFLKGKAA
jgi:hypothetical protein